MTIAAKQEQTARTSRGRRQRQQPSRKADLDAHMLSPRRLGQSLGMKAKNESEAIAQILAGLPYKCLETFRRNSGLPMDRLTHLLRIAPRTLARRKVQGRLDIDESERLLRLGRVLDRTLHMVGGDTQDAMDWLTTPAPSLGGQLPLEYATTEMGAEEVVRIINRLEHGVFM